METLKKLNKAIELIKSKNLKKKGRNKFSNYDYYTPDQVAELTTWASHEVNLFPKFDLIRNELGITGKLSIYDIESDSEPVVFEMASAIPEIKATNVSQQLGGAMTYTKRYLLMTAFDIVDNNLDFDTTENTKKQVAPSETLFNGLDSVATKSLLSVIRKANTQETLKKLWENNSELHSDNMFKSEITKRKKILIDNGIEK
jgi:hypothetical protein